VVHLFLSEVESILLFGENIFGISEFLSFLVSYQRNGPS
jgi:hypothetical protein